MPAPTIRTSTEVLSGEAEVMRIAPSGKKGSPDNAHNLGWKGGGVAQKAPF
jgi:hypothetical protein